MPEPTGTRDPVGRDIQRFRYDEQSLEYMVNGAEGLRPMVLLQALEFPAWPSQEFCDLAEKEGYQIISVRRPGFGTLPPLPDLDRQVTLISAFLSGFLTGEVVLVCAGTSNMFGYRLAGNPRIGLTVLANCCFNHDPMAEIQPEWFARSIAQTLSSTTGARLALMGLQGAEGVFGKYWVTENFMQKSPGDLDYLRRNRDLFTEATDCMLNGVDIHTFILELRATLQEDPVLTDGCFEGLTVISISGEETSENWKASIRAEAARVSVPLHFLPSGDALVVYQSASGFLNMIAEYT